MPATQLYYYEENGEAPPADIERAISNEKT